MASLVNCKALKRGQCLWVSFRSPSTPAENLCIQVGTSQPNLLIDSRPGDRSQNFSSKNNVLGNNKNKNTLQI